MMFACLKRPDGRWTVRDLESRDSVLPPRFEQQGLDHASAILLATLLNTLQPADLTEETPSVNKRCLDA